MSFKVDPNKKGFVPVADVIYREIETFDPNSYDIKVPDHFVLRVDLGDTRGPSTYVAYAPKGIKRNPVAMRNILQSLVTRAQKDLLNG